MESIESLFKQSFLKLSVALLLIGTIILPLFLFLHLFVPEIFKDYSLLKLIFLAASICFPAWLINFVLVSKIVKQYCTAKGITVNEQLSKLVLVNCFLSLPIMYIPCILRLFLEFERVTAIKIAFSSEVILFSGLVISLLATIRRK